MVVDVSSKLIPKYFWIKYLSKKYYFLKNQEIEQVKNFFKKTVPIGFVSRCQD